MPETHIRKAILALAVATDELTKSRLNDRMEDECLHMIVLAASSADALASVLHHIERRHMMGGQSAVQKS